MQHEVLRDVHDTDEQWPVDDGRVAYQGAVTALRTDLVRMPDGATARRDYLDHPGAVGILALDGDDRLLLLNQYRHPVRLRMWEVPAGLLDKPGEHPLDAARRELHEEAHCAAGRWNVLVDVHNSPGCSSEALRVFLARDLAASDGERYAAHHEEADMALAWVPLDDVVRLVLAGEVHNPTLVAGALALTAARARPGGLACLRPADAPWPARPF